MLHNCDRQNDYDKIMKPNGLFRLAQRLQHEGKTRFLGFSGHTVDTALQAVNTASIDMLMFPVNLSAHTVPGKQALFQTCVRKNIGIAAMKPYGGGKLLSEKRTVQMARYQRGGETLKIKKTVPITPVQCLSYALAQPGVSTIVPGCATPEHVDAALACLDATDAEKDFADILASFEQYTPGECVYCNHCLPCPSAIDIGQVMRLLDAARQQLTEELQAAYRQLTANASDCTECGACEERCPFGVKVIEHMRQTAALFEA
jgi:predicted aldo/keto reductase-like oxidoreductase